MLLRPVGEKGGVSVETLNPGDILAGGESMAAGALTTVGAGTWLGSAIASGIIYRTGPTGAYTDTTDTAANILAALAGNNPAADVMPGTTFRLRVVNTVAFANTFAAGAGVIAGVGVVNIAASTWRDYLVTVLQVGPVVQVSSNTFSNTTVTFNPPQGQTAFPLVGYNALNIMPGMSVSGTGITAGTTVAGITQNQSGITGVTLSAVATATNSNVSLTFNPTVKFDGLGSGTL